MNNYLPLLDKILEAIEDRLAIHENKLSDYVKSEWPDSTLINIQKGKLAAFNEVQREVVKMRAEILTGGNVNG